MREPIKKLLDRELSRRTFGKEMMALGFSSVAVDSLLNSMVHAAEDNNTPNGEAFQSNRGKNRDRLADPFGPVNR